MLRMWWQWHVKTHHYDTKNSCPVIIYSMCENEWLRRQVRGILKICGTFFPTPVFYCSKWLKIHYLLQKTHPLGVYSPKTTQNSQLKNLGQNSEKSKNGLKSYFMLIDCLETWSYCRLQLFCLLKAVKPRKRVW